MGERLLWCDWNGDTVIEPDWHHEDTSYSLKVLRAARTMGDVRRSEAAFAQQALESYLEVDESEDGDEPPDETPFSYREISDWISEFVPLPHDAERAAQWVGWELLHRHCEVGGASPGGHIDTYTARDRDAFLEALREAGHDVVYYPSLMQEYWSQL